ncbi:MAG: hypothetical protein QW331_02050 [Candidatus Woesearchaeota archaeon]
MSLEKIVEFCGNLSKAISTDAVCVATCIFTQAAISNVTREINDYGIVAGLCGIAAGGSVAWLYHVGKRYRKSQTSEGFFSRIGTTIEDSLKGVRLAFTEPRKPYHRGGYYNYCREARNDVFYSELFSTLLPAAIFGGIAFHYTGTSAKGVLVAMGAASLSAGAIVATKMTKGAYRYLTSEKKI